MKHLPERLILVLLRLISHLPHGLRQGLGCVLGQMLRLCLPYRRRVVVRNLDLAFPEYSDKQKKALLKQHFNSVGIGITEMGLAWFASDERLRALCDFEADAEALRLLQSDAPAILMGSHSTLLELGVRLLGLHVPASGLYRPLKNEFFNAWIKKQRERAADAELVHFKDMRHTLAVLNRGGKLWYAIDQDMGAAASVFVPFFGIDTASLAIMPKLQAKTGAHLIPVYMWRRGKRFVVRIGREIQGKDAADIMRQMNAELEAEIRQQPEQYYWLHRRFKTLPDGSRRPY